MGLLDDAIREHLQLKLRHGTDPAEVTRLEDEALSPVPRDRKYRSQAALEAAKQAPKPEAGKPDPKRERSETALQPTAEYDVAAAYAAENSAGEPSTNGHGSDPLEETPDFLDETPEHDRLWFEQKPPSKFDF
jgi:hypothetical protein